jgi:hypothetical protein
MVLLAVAAALAAGCASPLPEAGTPAADLYVRRCATCHPPYNLGLLTAKMWEAMVQRMEVEMRRRGVQLSPEDRTEIFGYLARNAGES